MKLYNGENHYTTATLSCFVLSSPKWILNLSSTNHLQILAKLVFNCFFEFHLNRRTKDDKFQLPSKTMISATSA